MWNRLIIDGNAVYEVDEECMKKKQLPAGAGKPGGPIQPGRETKK